jgi:spore coat protein U-like protein
MMRTAVLLAALAATSAAADTANLNVTANIQGTCVIQSVQSVNFGDLQQGTTAPDKTVPGNITYWCTKGASYTVTLGMGNNPQGNIRRMKGQASTNQSEFLPYDLDYDGDDRGGVGKGPRSPERRNITGTVRGADYNALSVGGFQDTVVVTITP